MIDKVTTIDNAHLYCVYTMLYVNDLACNSVKQIKSYIPQSDKEAKKIFGALEKRCNRYLRAIDKICGSGNIFYADYNGEIDDMVSADIENLTQAIRNAYNGEESENVEYFTKVEIARTFVELSISVIDDLLDALKDKELKTGNIKGYKLLEIRGIIDNFAKWVYRKAKTNIDLNEDKDAISALDAVTKSLCDYKNFIKAYEYAVEMEKQDSSKKVNNLMNYNVKIDLKKLEKVAVMPIQGKTGLIKCVVIPVEENNIFVSEKTNGGIYLDLKASEVREMRFGQSHILKRTVGKEAYSKMTKEEIINMPIVGSLSPYNSQGMEATQSQASEPKAEQQSQSINADELPF